MKHVLYYLLCSLILPVACIAPKPVAKPGVINLSSIYNPTNTRFHPVYSIYHNSPSTSLLLIKIFPSELLYSGIIEPDKLLGQVRISYLLTDITDIQKPEIVDSVNVTYSFNRENADKRFQTQLSLQTQTGKRYQLAITAKDLVRNEVNLNFMFIDKNLKSSEQNFLAIYTEDNSPVYQPYVVGNSTFRISSDLQDSDSVYVFYYGKEIPLPRPSYSLSIEKEFLEKPDSVWILPFRKNVYYQLNYAGIYHFILDTTISEGLTLLNFGEAYPKVQDAKHMIEPLAYLTTSTEYDALKKATNQKLAVDDFWIGKAGNIEQARELIKVYYNRVFFANYYFTSYKPGWKTDRGMIFIIYGPPQSVKVTPSQEKWIYYKNNFSTMVTFTFDHTPAAFSLDNYTLQRSDSYDTYWRNAIDTWRKGKIYMIE